MIFGMSALARQRIASSIRFSARTANRQKKFQRIIYFKTVCIIRNVIWSNVELSRRENWKSITAETI